MFKVNTHVRIIGILSLVCSFSIESRSIGGHIVGASAAGLTSTGLGYGSYVLSKKMYERFLSPSIAGALARVHGVAGGIVGTWLFGRYVHDRAYVFYSKEALSPVYAKETLDTLKDYLQSVLVSKILDNKIKELSGSSGPDSFEDVSFVNIEEILSTLEKILGTDAALECRKLYTWYQNFDQTKFPCDDLPCADLVDMMHNFAPIFYSMDRGVIDSQSLADIVTFMIDMRARTYKKLNKTFRRTTSILSFEAFIEKTCGCVLVKGSAV